MYHVISFYKNFNFMIREKWVEDSLNRAVYWEIYRHVVKLRINLFEGYVKLKIMSLMYIR